jgi:hypothetical protein
MITVKGIRVDYVNIERDAETGGANIKDARYSLISSTDHVLAQQGIGGYNGMAIKPTQDTIKLLNDFMTSYKKDVVTILGLEKE